MRLFILLFVYSVTTCFAQNPTSDHEKDFLDFKKKETEAFLEYKEKIDQEIISFLKEEWKEFKKVNATPPPFSPVPISIPTEIPKPIDQPNAENLPLIQPDNSATNSSPKNDIKNPENNTNSTHESKPQNEASSSYDSIKSPERDVEKNENFPEESVTNSLSSESHSQANFKSKTTLNYYGTSLVLGYEPEFLTHCNSIDEKGVSDFWAELSKKDYIKFVQQLTRLKEKHHLNDWATYLLIKNISENLIRNVNDRICFQFFFLNHMMYDVRMAKTGKVLTLLLPLKETVYGMSYLEIKNKKYYILSDSQESFFTFEKSLIASQKDISLLMSEPISLQSRLERKSFELQGGKKISLEYNLNHIGLFEDYPQSDLEVFFNSMTALDLDESIRNAFIPLLVGMNEWEAVNFLLSFVQKEFVYKTDFEQFGKEKWFFPEDQLHYKFSDCEDRSVFFAYLVKTLLKLDIVGLNYPEHVAVAVKFNGSVNGDYIRFKNSQYIICDPTYIGASAGMCMPQFKNKTAKIIEIIQK